MQPEQMSLGLNSQPYEHSDRATDGFRNPAIALTITSASDSEYTLQGFLHFWAIYVRGFNPRFHCQKAFRGTLSRRVKTRSTELNTRLILDEVRAYDSVYVCGVANGPRSCRALNNVHLAMEPRSGYEFVEETYNGLSIRIENAIKLPIPEIPDGWQGLPERYTRCCNFRFCVYRFGYRSNYRLADATCVTKLPD
jgi:hypothetical protein